MKKLGIIVVVLAAVLLVAPFGIGKVAESRLNKGLDKLIEQAPYLKISERTWSGGWFKSTQTVTFELSDTFADAFGKKAIEGMLNDQEAAVADAAMDAEGTEAGAVEQEPAEEAPAEEAATDESTPDEAPAAGAPVKFVIRNDVLHGPILGAAGVGLARVDTSFDLSEDVRKKIEEVFGTERALEVVTRVGFFGGGTTTFKSEGRKLNIDNKEVDFTYETFKMSVGVSGNADKYDIDGKLPSLVVKDASGGTNFTLTDMTIKGDGERVMGDLYDGEVAFKIKEMKFKGKGSSDEMGFQDAHYIVDTRTKDDFSDVTAKIGTGAVQSEQFKQFGIEVKEIHYDFSLRHLHAPTLDKIMQGMRAMYTTPLVGGPEKVEDAVFGPMKQHAGELLNHDPAFGIDRVGLVTPEGEIVAKGVIKLVGATTEDFTGGAGPMALIGKIDADITIEAAQKVLEKFPNGATMAGGAVDAGYAKRDGDKLVCHITFKNGELLVNGKPQAIPGLGGPPPNAMEGAEGPPMEGEEVPQE